MAPFRSAVFSVLALGTATALAQSAPSISINDVTVTEGTNPGAVFTVSISADPRKGRDLRVSYATQNDTAQAGQDFNQKSGELTFQRGGPRSQTVSVDIINDVLVENTESFRVLLSNPVNGTIADGTGVGTIRDNDTPANSPPTCRIDTPTENTVTIAVGGTVNYSATVTDPNNNLQSITWSFCNNTNDCTPNSSSVEDPGLVTYLRAGTYTTSLTARDTTNLSCTTQTKTVQVQAAAAGKSINSTAVSCGGVGEPSCPTIAVGERPQVTSRTDAWTLLTINDLGMHCGDLDTRVASILPPFNVLHSQVIQRASDPTLNPTGVSVFYSAASNPNDPYAAIAATRVPSTGGVFKTNFWDIARQAYAPFYPAGILAAFYPLSLDIRDLGLPVPDVERLYLGDGQLVANQQSMPSEVLRTPAVGVGPITARQINAYNTMSTLGSPPGNTPQLFQLFVQTQPFFIDFPFGYTAEVGWFEAAGIPVAAFDDAGRENPYPLMRVEARNTSGTVLATTDTVTPISAEADCQICHAAPVDGGNGTATTQAGLSVITNSLGDPKLNQVPLAASIEWASDKNILSLHDLRNGTNLIGQEPVVCQKCHYTPALDLAQVGPNDVNGRQQSNNQTMSRVMHNHHGSLPGNLFPSMPAPTQDPTTGVITNQAARLDVLDQTCYRCHPGDRTQCLRGAMFNGGMLCQDCHGGMTQVGDDFSRNKPGGQFILAADFYTNPATPRVPWANEPGCGSCHAGDASSNLSGTGYIKNVKDVYGNTDNIRLIQAFQTGNAKATPIVPTNKRFAEDVVTSAENSAAAGNPKLYRVSTGHGGVFCEGCHGSTHAEWPNANPNANDNQAAIQLQGHTGTIVQCDTCHSSERSGTGGPHNMHWVSPNSSNNGQVDPNVPITNFNNGGHSSNSVCFACHGGSSRNNAPGTVLSRAQADRTLFSDSANARIFVPKGTPIGCTLCHN